MKRILSLLSAFCPALMACALSPADATTDSVTEQAFVAFLDGIADMPQAQAVQAVDSVMQAAQARPGNFYNMAYWADAHLYEPASDRADERLYEPFARAVIASALTGLGEKAAAEWKLGAIALNAPGERPCDFFFRLADGTVARLGDIAGAEPVLLFFYDPDCHHCRLVMREIKDSIGGLKVLAVCVDSTQERWLRDLRRAAPGVDLSLRSDRRAGRGPVYYPRVACDVSAGWRRQSETENL